MSGKINFRSISLCYSFIFSMLLRLYMNLFAVFSWTLIGPFCLLYTSAGKVYFGIHPFSFRYVSLSFNVRLHTNTTPDCSSPVFFSEFFV